MKTELEKLKISNKEIEREYFSNGKIFLITKTKVLQVHYSQAQGCFYTSALYQSGRYGKRLSLCRKYIFCKADVCNSYCESAGIALRVKD